MSNFDKITEIIECESIISQLRSSAAFSFKKKGYIRLIKDYLKRSYFLEFFAFTNNKAPNEQKPCLVLNLSLDGLPQFKQISKICILKSLDGVVHIEIKNEPEYKLFQEKLLKCLNDKNFIDDSFIIQDSKNKQGTNPKLNFFEIKPSPAKKAEDNKSALANIKIKKDEILEMYGLNGQIEPEPKKDAFCSQTTKAHNENEKSQKNENSTIPNKKFYSTSSTSSSNVLRNLNSTNTSFNIIRNLETIQTPTSLKRRRDSDDYLKQDIKILEDKKEILTPKRNLPTNSKLTPSQINTRSSSKKANYSKENQENFFSFENEDSLLKSPIKTWNRNNSKSFGKGFSNLGNTCYMNAILQCLLNIDIFSYDLLNKCDQIKSVQTKLNYNKNSDNLLTDETQNQIQKQENLYNCLCELVKARETHNESLKIQSLKDIKNTISKEATRFLGYQQHDAHEFLCQVLDQLKEEIDKSLNSYSEKLNDLIKNNPIVDNFQFKITHAIECKKCFNSIKNYEEYNNLCLELPDFDFNQVKKTSISIQDTLDIFFKDEFLNDFKCEKCNTIEEVLISRKFLKLPRILILHLKRYQLKEKEKKQDQESELEFKLVKNDSVVQISRFLTLKNLLTTDSELILPKPIDKNFYDLKKYSFSSTLSIRPRSPFRNLNFSQKKMNSDFDELFVNESINELNENEQINLALKLSLENENKNETNKIKKSILTNSVNIKLKQQQQHQQTPKYLDGTSDRDLEQDENSNQSENNLFDNLKKYSSRGLKRSSRADLSKKFTSMSTQEEEKEEEEENEDEEIKKAKEQSLITYKAENKLLDYLKEEISSDIIEDPFEDDNDLSTSIKDINYKLIPLIKRSESAQKLINENAKTGKEANSYRIIGIVSHLGSSSNSGHYISDVYNVKTKTWSSFDDSKVEILTEEQVFEKRVKTGYIFFYIHNSLIPDF